MNVTQNIIKDIENLRGATVRIFGQPSTLPDAVGAFEIDVIDILKVLSEYEISLSDYVAYDDNDNEIANNIYKKVTIPDENKTNKNKKRNNDTRF